MIKVNYNAITGEILGYYPDDFGYETIPEPFIEITEEEHSDCINNQGFRKVENGKIVQCEPIVPVLTKKERSIILTSEYQQNVEKIQNAYILANMNNDEALKTNLTALFRKAKQEYEAKRGVIENG